MVHIIDYIDGSTLFHKANPISKLAFAIGLIAATFMANTYPVLISLLIINILISIYTKNFVKILSLAKVLLPLAIIMIVLQSIVVREGEPLWLFVTTQGLESGTKVALRLVGVALPLVSMLAVTQLSDLANASVQILHIPYRYAFTFTTALRFVPIFSQELNAIVEAQTSRGIAYDTKNPFKKMRLMLPLYIPLLVSSVQKTDATALAAEQRGFYLRSARSSYKRFSFQPLDYLLCAAAVLLCVIGFLA